MHHLAVTVQIYISCVMSASECVNYQGHWVQMVGNGCTDLLVRESAEMAPLVCEGRDFCVFFEFFAPPETAGKDLEACPVSMSMLLIPFPQFFFLMLARL